MEKRRVVVTGIGVVAPNGIGIDPFWDSLVHGRSGIKTIEFFDTSSYACKVAGHVDEFNPADYVSPKNVRRMDRFSQFGVACSKLALTDSNIDLDEIEHDRIGISVGSSVGGNPQAEDQYAIFLEKGLNRVNPLLSTRFFIGSCMNNICMELGIHGPCFSISTGCATGADNIGIAFDMIRGGKLDLMLTGAVETPLSPLTFGSFSIIGILTTQNEPPHGTPKPFDRYRDGIVLSEGGAVLVLEELQHAMKRQAKIYAEIVGFATTHDGYHLTQPAPDGAQAERAIEMALQDGGVQIEEVDYICAHGSGTILNDRIESMIIKRMFYHDSKEILVSSIESMIGHPLGAAGALKIASAACAIHYGIIPPTINYEHPDPECDLNYVPNKSIKKELSVVVSNSFSFGGKNSVIVLRKV